MWCATLANGLQETSIIYTVESTQMEHAALVERPSQQSSGARTL